MSDGELAFADSDEEEEEFYEVDKIVDHKTEGKKTFYKVRWKGYSPSQDTWEPQDHLGEGCDEVIAAYFDWKAANVKNKHKKKGVVPDTSRNDGKGLKNSKPVPQPEKASTLIQEFNQTSISQDEQDRSKTLLNASTNSVELSIFNNQTPNKGEQISLNKLKAEQLNILTSRSETDTSMMEDSDTAGADSIEDVFTVNPSTPVFQKQVENESQCCHQAEFQSLRAQEYDKLSRHYETGSDADMVTDSRKCITVLMSQLCDPSCTNMDGIFEEIEACVSRWCKKARQQLDPTTMSLSTALLVVSEAAILANPHIYKDDISKAIPGNWMPLHFAAARHKFDVCDWILEQGCWSDTVTINQETPLTLTLKSPGRDVDCDKMLHFVTKLVSEGANVLREDSSGTSPIAMAMKHKYTSIVSILTAQHQRLQSHTSSLIASHLKAHSDNLYLKEYFLEPQLITQPSGVTYIIRFKFKEPTEQVVARLTVAYYVPAEMKSASDISQTPVTLTSSGPFPFKTILLNGHNIRPTESEYMSMTLQSQLVIGSNILELEMIDYSEKKLLDSAIIFGCLIGRSTS
ncbi:uncharacterized protein [Watersipora subatra]|uniref:uncharacterized protein isoform X2 n=1 Tax=Watersipora subatra TaxID=2589382 RepID=UPI00355B5380